MTDLPHNNKKIAIIIMGYNSLRHLPDCLGSLRQLDYPTEQYQVYVFDNASTDQTAEVIKRDYPEVSLIVNDKNFGFAGGYNKAIEVLAARNYDYYFLLNDDTITDRQALSAMVKVLDSDANIAAVQARLMLYPEKDKVNSIGNQIHFLGFGFSAGNNQAFDNNLQPREITYGSGCALLVKKEIIDRLGLFEPDFFMYHEDLDFGWRIRLAGYKTFLAPRAVVYHKYHFAKSMKQYYWMERNRIICILKNYQWLTIVLITPACLIMELGLLLFALKSGFWQEKLKVYIYFFQLSSWRKILQRRKITQQLRQVKDREVARNFVGKITNQEIANWLLDKIANPVFNLYWQIIKNLLLW